MEATVTQKDRVRANFDHEAQGWFLTWPHCPLTPKDILIALRNIRDLPRIKKYVICTEPHADGTPHAHAFVQYESKVVWRSNRWNVLGYQGHYEKARSWFCVQNYCKKGDNFIQENCDPEAAKKHKASRNKELIHRDPIELVETGVIGLLQLNQLIIARQLWSTLQVPTLPRCIGFIPNALGIIMALGSHKQRNYWLWSGIPNTGKTTFLSTLMQTHPCHLYNTEEKYQDSILPGAQFVLFDEYSAPKLTWMQLNSICDGTFQYPRKGLPATTLTERPIVIICGNKHPSQVYTSDNSLQYIEARFQVIELTNAF